MFKGVVTAMNYDACAYQKKILPHVMSTWKGSLSCLISWDNLLNKNNIKLNHGFFSIRKIRTFDFPAEQAKSTFQF